MQVQQQITAKLDAHFAPIHLDVVNESHQHNVPAGSESHFKVTLVSAEFDGKRLIQRHRMVNQLLAEELAGPVHALALHTYTAQEWQTKTAEVPASPQCLGGSKR
ncbi:transcriptional regulator BolA [Alteromonas flava]|uniref:transcriptional regulator BolA n=1 Tax=Alteromonas flava TaxID=2048003 RepID=UPI000C28F114|nr:transcriptional regulator BolA [Alteromonas flava]